ncbi:MAG: zinc-dependent metalloprotease, partial [Cellulomonas sp.]|nr:zinc-dependent metalloprotease [Cellulomonas sp.]
MSSEPPTGSSDAQPPEWEELLRQMFGADADEAMRELRERGMDPAAMAAAAGLPDDPQMLGVVLGQVQKMLAASGTGPVNWDVA